MRIPKFESIEEEAEFWDNTDTSDILLNAKKRISKGVKKSKLINKKGSEISVECLEDNSKNKIFIGELAKNKG
jgi:hypothetical protein